MWRNEPFPGRFDNPLSQSTPDSGPVSRGLASILTYKEEDMFYAGVEWANDHHDVLVIDDAAHQLGSLRVAHSRKD